MSSLATYISLPGRTAEAMEHWQQVFGGELVIIRYRDMPMEGLPFEPDPQAVAHATLTLEVGHIAGSDIIDSESYPIGGTAYSLLYTTDSAEEARGYFQALLNGGGTEGMPFEKAPWGDWYGQVFDRFGVMWALSSEND